MPGISHTAHYLACVLVQHVAQAHWPGIFSTMSTKHFVVDSGHVYGHVQSHGNAESVHKTSMLSDPPVLRISNQVTQTQTWVSQG